MREIKDLPISAQIALERAAIRFDFRCKKCGKLLCKTNGKCEIEIKCPRCGEMNVRKENVEDGKEIHGKM